MARRVSSWILRDAGRGGARRVLQPTAVVSHADHRVSPRHPPASLSLQQVLCVAGSPSPHTQVLVPQTAKIAGVNVAEEGRLPFRQDVPRPEGRRAIVRPLAVGRRPTRRTEPPLGFPELFPHTASGCLAGRSARRGPHPRHPAGVVLFEVLDERVLGGRNLPHDVARGADELATTVHHHLEA